MHKREEIEEKLQTTGKTDLVIAEILLDIRDLLAKGKGK
jgi:hypothetical protein